MCHLLKFWLQGLCYLYKNKNKIKSLQRASLPWSFSNNSTLYLSTVLMYIQELDKLFNNLPPKTTYSCLLRFIYLKVKEQDHPFAGSLPKYPGSAEVRSQECHPGLPSEWRAQAFEPYLSENSSRESSQKCYQSGCKLVPEWDVSTTCDELTIWWYQPSNTNPHENIKIIKLELYKVFCKK